MASKLSFGAWALVAAWIVWPTQPLQGEPPAWILEGQEAGESFSGGLASSPQVVGSGATDVTSKPPGFLPLENEVGSAVISRADAGLAPSTTPNDGSGFGAGISSPAAGASLPPQPAPMFPAGPSLAAAGDMIGFSRELAGGTQAITLINASRRWMAVYHVDQAGQIRLVSSRPLDADFSFQFNATAPLPEEIRRLQGR